MYRTLVSIFICVSAVQTAPQEVNTQITNDKPSSVTDTLNTTRESRIENIPPIVHLDKESEEDSTKNERTSEGDSTINSEDDNRNKNEEESIRNEENKRTPALHLNGRSEENGINQASKIEADTRNTKDSGNINSSQEWKRNEENKRTVRSDVTTVSYDSETTSVTERDNDIAEIVEETEEYESRTKPPAPRFISKLSYFQKNDYSSPVLTNLVERPGRRRFNSKCRCEKICNCPKLQITVPRCPNEYFLCCF